MCSYQSRQDAESMGLYHINERSGVVRLGVDSTHKYSLLEEGRPSIRIESKETYDHGLFIADFLHMPPSHCGLWPAFWTYGDNWPFDGEVDIIEGVNTAHTNIMSAHTADGCTQSPSIDGLYSGEQLSTQCAVGSDNIGCGFNPSSEDVSSYGDGFNAAHGGVYAMEWDPVHIRIWHFSRGSIPKDIENKKPDPDKWGQPVAIFGGESCDVDRYFKNMRLVLNINFCGDYGNAVWGKSDICHEFAPTCAEYVAENPEAFANAYWDIRYIDAYQFRPHIRNPRPSRPSRPDRPDRPGSQDESTTTTTMTTRSTTTVTVFATGHHPHGPQGHVPITTAAAAIEPAATKAPVNPIKIGDYSYLGCFHSSSDFKSFREVADGKDMALERCVKLCDNKTYVGVFDTRCFCAEHLDARTRATKREGLCNHACPGNHQEFCGGIVGSGEDHGPSKRNETASSRFALTIYGRVAEEKPEPPPAMAPGSNVTTPKPYRPPKVYSETVTAVAEVTVFPISEHDSHGEKHEEDEDGGEKHRDHKHEDGKHEGDEHEKDKHQGGGGESVSWTPPVEEDCDDDAEEKWKPAKPVMPEIAAPATETVVDCPEGFTTKEAIVIPTWLPPIEPKPWVHFNVSSPPPPPPSHHGDGPPPPPHVDGIVPSHPPPPPPPSPTGAPVNGPVLVAAAPGSYQGMEKYLVVLGLSVLAVVMGPM
ncbi:glycoside hydrolase family 16 protein [Trichoderma ceciliae]